MDVFKGMTIFAEVAHQHGFAHAARALNLSTSAVSRYVIELEDWLGVQRDITSVFVILWIIQNQPARLASPVTGL